MCQGDQRQNLDLATKAPLALGCAVPALERVQRGPRVALGDQHAGDDQRVALLLDIQGTQHIVGRVSQDATERLHFGFTRNTQGTGIGYTSGDHYILTDTVARTSVEVVPGDVRVFTEQYHERLIRRGEATTADDTLIHFLTKITLNANGDMTASVEIQSVTCD